MVRPQQVLVGQVRDACPTGAVPVYIGRPGVLGNPFPLRSNQGAERQRVIEAYEEHLRPHLAVDASGPLAEELRALRTRLEQGETVLLRCFCSPLPCHGDVIRAALLEMGEGQRPPSVGD